MEYEAFKVYHIGFYAGDNKPWTWCSAEHREADNGYFATEAEAVAAAEAATR